MASFYSRLSMYNDNANNQAYVFGIAIDYVLADSWKQVLCCSQASISILYHLKEIVLHIYGQLLLQDDNKW